MATLTKLEVVAAHILKHLQNVRRPLFVAIQGPQGSGKTYLCSQLRDYLSSKPHSLRTALLSIDDLYLPHEKLVELANKYPKNSLWHGRGQPGTHDVELGVRILTALKGGTHSVELPRFDKSLYDGEGDRLPMDGSGVLVEQPPAVDVVILEGWCVGFYPIPQSELDKRWNGIWQEECQKLNLNAYNKSDIEVVNEVLVRYALLWDFFDVFIQIRPASFDDQDSYVSKYNTVYHWRLEQEHYMKAQNGGKGMTDEAVKRFVDRYIPGYIFFGDIPPTHTLIDPPKWTGKSLSILIDHQRRFLKAVNC